MTDKNLSIGVDIGARHVSCVALDLDRGEMIPGSDSRLSLDSFADAGTILNTWGRALESTCSRIDESRLAGIGFAMPGPFDYRNGISLMEHKYPRLYRCEIASELRSRVDIDPETPVRFLNDASAFAVGEAWLGKGSCCRKVVAITLGTGLGSAFVDDGIPVVGGEEVPVDGCLWQLPFRYGSADQFFTTRWFVKEHADRLGGKVSGAKEVAELAEDGDATALAIFERFGANLAGFLVPWLSRFQADVLVIGGRITRAYRFFGPLLEEGLREEGVDSLIKISEKKERYAMIGAARLSDDSVWDSVSAQLPAV
jgi:glucokinase